MLRGPRGWSIGPEKQVFDGRSEPYGWGLLRTRLPTIDEKLATLVDRGAQPPWRVVVPAAAVAAAPLSTRAAATARSRHRRAAADHESPPKTRISDAVTCRRKDKVGEGAKTLDARMGKPR